MATFNHLNSKSLFKLPLSVTVAPREHVGPAAGKRNGGNSVAEAKGTGLDHSSGPSGQSSSGRAGSG